MAAPVLSNKDLHKSISNYQSRNSKVIKKVEVKEAERMNDISPIATFPEKASTIAKFDVRKKNVSIVGKDTSMLTAAIDAAAGSTLIEKQLEVVIGDDDREKVSDVLDTPWRKIAALKIKAANGRTYVGTAWFISPRVLATAGHCVYMHEAGGWPQQIEVIPALNGDIRPYGQAISTKFESNNGWINDRNSDYDYGVIILDKALSEEIGWFAFAAAEDNYLNSNIANISGYPADLDKATKQYYHARKITRSSSRRIYYDIDTYGGDSGAPVWMNFGENKRVAIGIHTNGGSTSNFGTRITDEIYKNLQNWKKL
jgi:glutamyl endopeptidase